jgi:ferredoxin
MFGRQKVEVKSLNIFTFDCIGCGKCVAQCRHNVLSLVNNGSCKYAVVVNRSNCLGCGKCVQICRAKAIELDTLIT